jgi:hypothetical protein
VDAIQKGEWEIDNLYHAEDQTDLRARVQKRGAILVPWNEVVVGHIVGANQTQPGSSDAAYGLYTKGYIRSMNVDVTNTVPTRSA